MTTLAELVDLSLGTPEIGAVNFSILHNVLHQILLETKLNNKSVDNKASDRKPLAKQNNVSDSNQFSTPYHALQDKVCQLEDNLNMLNSLPDNKDIMALKELGGAGSKPVSEMWQLMQVKKKAQANEDGVNKLMSMMEDLLNAHNHVKADNEILKNKINSFNQLAKELNDKSEELTKLVKEVQQLEENDRSDIEKLKERMANAEANLPLKELQDQINARLKSIPEDFTVFATKDFVKDNYLGLNDFNKYRDDMNKALNSKANQSDFDVAMSKLDKIPEDISDQMNHLIKAVDTLKADRDSDAEALLILQETVYNLQQDSAKFNETLKNLAKEFKDFGKGLATLEVKTETLDMLKADKETVQVEIDLKADKKALDSKIGRNLFNSKTGELDDEIGKLKLRVGGCEEDYRKAIDELLAKVDNKLDRDELGPLKEWLENKLKGLKPKLVKQEYRIGVDDPDAAGFRKSATFFCLSCDKRVRNSAQIAIGYPWNNLPLPNEQNRPVPSIPANSALPAHKSSRPYTIYELEQIRLAQRTQGVDPDAMYSALGRPVGGSHTMTHSARRQTKTPLSAVIQEDDVPTTNFAEMDIMGVDGRIYRGRKEEAPNSAVTELPEISAPPSAASRRARTTSKRSRPKPSTPSSIEMHESVIAPPAAVPEISTLG